MIEYFLVPFFVVAGIGCGLAVAVLFFIWGLALLFYLTDG